MSKGIVLLIFIIQLSLLVTLIKLTFKERGIYLKRIKVVPICKMNECSLRNNVVQDEQLGHHCVHLHFDASKYQLC